MKRSLQFQLHFNVSDSDNIHFYIALIQAQVIIENMVIISGAYYSLSFPVHLCSAQSLTAATREAWLSASVSTPVHPQANPT